MRSFREMNSDESTGVDLKFVNILPAYTAGGIPYKKFVLETPIPYIPGRLIRDDDTNEPIQLEVFNVDTIGILPDALEELYKLDENAIKAGKPEDSPFTWDVEGKSGRLNLPTFFKDVSEALEPWIVKERFAQWAAGRAANTRKERRSKLRQDLADNRTRAELGAKGAGATETPTPTADTNNNSGNGSGRKRRTTVTP